MAAMIGVVNEGGPPIAARAIDALERSITRFGRIHSARLARHNIYVSTRHHDSEREHAECALTVEADGTLCAWDGRLDNRDELLLQLCPADSPAHDGQLALAAYARWGIAGLGRLSGEWSVALWNERDSSIVLARDHFGGRPLFYSNHTAGYFAWSSSLGALVSTLRCCDDLDDAYIIGVLTGHPPTRLTPYKNVFPVPPGYAVTWTAEHGCRPVRIWTPPHHEVRLEKYDDYKAALLQHFIAAVKTRLRYRETVWAELSGGLDSSSVVCMAAHLIRNGLVAPSRLDTISFFAEGPSADERPYMRTVEEYSGVRGHHLLYDTYRDNQANPWRWVSPGQRDGITYEMWRRVHESGSTTLLTGQNGDSVMGNTVGEASDVAEMLRRFNLRHALTTARGIALARRVPIYPLWVQAFSWLTPNAWSDRHCIQRQLAALGADRGALWERVGATWLLPDRLIPIWIEEARAALRVGREYPDWTKLKLLRNLECFAERGSTMAECDGVAATHPMMHRPLIEFVLAIPSEVWRPIGKPRGLMRDAFAPFVPARIISRRAKGDPSPPFIQHAATVAANWLSRLETLHIVKRGWIDAARLRQKLTDVSNGCCRSVIPLPMLINVERWLEVRTAQLANGVDGVGAESTPSTAAVSCSK